MNMRRWLVCGGVDGKPEGLHRLRQAVARRRPDGVLFAGGVLSPRRAYVPRLTHWDLAHADALFLNEFFETLGGLGTFAAVIPGPRDGPLDDFLRMGMSAEIEFPKVHLAHATLIQERDVAVCGLGGRIACGCAVELDCCSRTQAEYALRTLWAAPQPRKVLLLAAPPPGSLGGKEGTTLTGELIDTYHPALCVVGDGNERRGCQRIAGTLVVNPGHLADGVAAWVDWSRPGADRAEFLDLWELDSAVVPHKGGLSASGEL